MPNCNGKYTRSARNDNDDGCELQRTIFTIVPFLVDVQYFANIPCLLVAQDDEIAGIDLRARHREEAKRYRVLGGVSILESPTCPESTNLKSTRSAKFWSNVATNMQYTPRLRPFG